MESIQRHSRYFLTLLAIGVSTGLLALVPKVGWLLGLSAFALAYRYARRTTFIGDALVTLLLWLLIRELALRVN
jgi:hypothetical protein